MRRHLLLFLVTIGLPHVALAQRYWKSYAVPYLFYSTIDGFWLAGLVKAYSPVGFEDQAEPDRAWGLLSAGASTAGSRAVTAELAAPAWWDGWRLRLRLSARRDNRWGYYGLGNATEFHRDSMTDVQPYFYRVSRSARVARLTVQRRLVGSLRALGGVGLEYTDFRELPGESVFRRDHAGGVVDSSDVPLTDAVWRVGLVVDTRDHEIDPRRGILAEGLFSRGHRYTRTTGWAHAWIEPVERFWLALRIGAEHMTGTPPVAALLTMEESEGSLAAVGGYHSLRGYRTGRFVGPGKLLGTAEVRYAVIWVPTLFELKIGAFTDVARVFGPGEDFRLTTDGLHTAAGGEIAMRFTPNGLLVLGIGASREGWQLIFNSGWAF